MPGPSIGRRHAIIAPLFGAAGFMIPAARAARANRRPSGSATCSTPRDAMALTQYGPVRGYLDDGVYTFKGIPYGADTGGENRWLPAKAPQRWAEDFHAFSYGPNCPQTLHDFRAVEHTFLQQWTDGFLGEDMLRLNIWTPALSGSKPVMVYFHGGGFSFGSSYELASHDGAQMARHHDVVQVSLNHRLNVLGFLDLKDVGGSAYEDSVNVSMTDCIAALRWVQENIAKFGGDPNKVMIYGQSGGGSKVTTLLGMQSGKNLIHRAAAQSGGGGALPTAEQSREFANRVLRRLEISSTDLRALQKIDWKPLYEAGNAVADDINGPRGPMGPAMTPRVGWNPTLDGRIIDVRSFSEVAPAVSRNVPLMVGNTSEEGMRWGYNPEEPKWRADLTKQIGAARADQLIAAMKTAHPEKTIRTLAYGMQGLMNRNRVQDMVRLKHAQGGAPVYQYLFQFQSPQLGGVAGAWHTADLAFCFDNVERCAQGTGNTVEARRLGRAMATAWATFARTGNPSQPSLVWTPSDPVRCQTMVFDAYSRMMDDPEGTARRVLLT